MQITQIINSVFRQDFSNKAVLGRALFGAGIFGIGLYNLLQIQSFASYAPSFLPFPALFVVLIGLAFLLLGFLVVANMHMKIATKGLIALYALFVVVVYLPTADWISLLTDLSLLGAALMMYAAACAKETESTEAK